MPQLLVDRTIAALRARLAPWRREGKIALVPTMGALHAGHLGLVRDARIRAARVVVSIFVNPKQFAPTEDFAAYPRDEEADLIKLAENGADVVFAPAAEEMYPDSFATMVTVAGPALDLEGVSRPHFFAGVTTVVAKLFHAAMPDVAVFGEKDYQQLAVIRRMVSDLAFPIEIAAHRTVREADGLAMSSRNAYLSAEDRRKAPLLHATLQEVAAAIRAGTSPDSAIAEASARLTAAGFLIDYLKLRNADTLEHVADVKREPLRLLAAAWLSKTRLIDNIAV